MICMGLSYIKHVKHMQTYRQNMDFLGKKSGFLGSEKIQVVNILH